MRGRAVAGSVAVVLALVAGGFLLDSAGARSPPGAAPADAPSGVWFCPHGGGRTGWHVWLSLTNPGSTSVRARVTTFGASQPTAPKQVTVPANGRVQVAVPSAGRERASMVEYFGGWIAAGWVARAGGGDSGVAAEACLARAGRSFFLPDGTTQKGQDAYVVVMNPFGSEAVFSLTLVTERRTVRWKSWSTYLLKPGRSAAFHLNRHALGEQTVAAQIEVSIGRVAAASLGVDAKGGIRSAVGIPTTATRLILPGVADAGPSDLALFDPARTAARYRVTVLGPSGPAPATGLVSQQLAPGSARTEHVTAGARALVVAASAGITAARRSFGLQGDQGSTSGALRAASAWVVPGAAFAGDNETRLYLANPGTRRVSVSVYALSRGSAPSPARTVDVPPGSTVLVDPKPGPQVASIVAVAKSGTFVPAEASYTARGIGFAVVTGVPIPTRWIPRG